MTLKNLYVTYLVVFRWRKRPSIQYVRNLGNGGESSKMCAGTHRGGERYHVSYVHKHLYYLFSSFCLIVSCFICRYLSLPSFKKCVFVRNGYFSPMGSISVVMKQAFFYLKLFFRTKVSKIFSLF